MQRIIALIILIVLSPFLIILALIVLWQVGFPIIYSQLRAGKNKKPFTIYKIRTMKKDAERHKKRLLSLNERDGPVFKIRNDPRFTKLGKYLSHTGLDELPQLINIIKGDMDFVGPRPLPIDEAKNVPETYNLRFSVLPGITSPWVIAGPNLLSFDEWMELDMLYVKNRSWQHDIRIFIKTVHMILKSIFLHATCHYSK